MDMEAMKEKEEGGGGEITRKMEKKKKTGESKVRARVMLDTAD